MTKLMTAIALAVPLPAVANAADHGTPQPGANAPHADQQQNRQQ